MTEAKVGLVVLLIRDHLHHVYQMGVVAVQVGGQLFDAFGAVPLGFGYRPAPVRTGRCRIRRLRPQNYGRDLLHQFGSHLIAAKKEVFIPLAKGVQAFEKKGLAEFGQRLFLPIPSGFLIGYLLVISASFASASLMFGSS